VGLIPSTSEIEVVFDEAWPGGTDLGGRCSPNRGAVLSDDFSRNDESL
jgi:hypothetical protein